MHGQGRLGAIVTQEDLREELRLPASALAYRVEYNSTSWCGRPTVVSGAVFVPAGPPPPGGWPVVSWAHGTVGVAEMCAPSRAGWPQRDIDYLDAWLGAGYVVAGTDYEGLGTPGRHPYDDGRSEAYGVTDMVRAAAEVAGPTSRAWVAIGHSQGGHASLWTASLADSYAPELDFRGAVATAPATQFLASTQAMPPLGPGDLTHPGVFTLGVGYLATHPDWDPGEFFTTRGQEVLVFAETRYCYDALGEFIASEGITNGDALKDMRVLLRFAELMRYDEIPVQRYGRPVFIAQGTADRLLVPGMTKKTADELAAAGTDVAFTYYQDADHDTILAAARPDLLAWVRARFSSD
jgi:acetyl esterase/lipase